MNFEGNDNIVSASLLAWRKDRLMEKKNLSKKYDLLGKKAKATIPGCYVKPYAEKIAALIVGGIAPDLQMKTPDGKFFLFMVKAKAKIMILGFWCGPCRAENPNVKKVYEKYKSKGLEIIGVSLDVKVDAWRKAIETDGLPWLHMSDLKGWNSIVTDVYQIHGIPMLFVLDENNRIVGEGLRGEELEKCVQKVLAQ
ncbi:MAG: TlpA family protein disulfide reductase [Odoribacter splanchnicus]